MLYSKAMLKLIKITFLRLHLFKAHHLGMNEIPR